MTIKPCLVLLAFILLGIAADASEDGASPPSSWRDAILAEAMQEFQKQSAVAAAAPPAPAPVSIFVREPVDPDVVVLEPLTVTERFDAKRFELAMEREYARSRVLKSRWGTGPLYTRDIGKVRVGVLSILYVPVMFGLSW